MQTLLFKNIPKTKELFNYFFIRNIIVAFFTFLVYIHKIRLNPIIQYAKVLSLNNFKASYGWLHNGKNEKKNHFQNSISGECNI